MRDAMALNEGLDGGGGAPREAARLRRAGLFALSGLAALAGILWLKFGSTVFVDMLGVVTSCF